MAGLRVHGASSAARSIARDLSGSFAATVLTCSAGSTEDEGARVGLEHEFTVRAGPHAVRFGTVIHGLGLGERHLDPADREAYRLPSGAAVTADGAEAEIALPPIRIRPGFTRELQSRADQEQARLARLLAPRLRLEGYSTHLSAGISDRVKERAATLYTRIFAPALMLLMDRRTSPGLLVRPRPGRLELCGEFVEGARLGAVAAFAVGSARVCELAATDRRKGTSLPEELVVRTVPGLHRHGLYVDRRAFGPDLYSNGRGATMHRVRGGSIRAQDHLELCWESARSGLLGLVDAEDVLAAERMVTGNLPLPSESAPQIPAAGTRTVLAESAFGSAVEPRERPAYGVAPVMLTWSVNVFLIAGSEGSSAFACVPSTLLAAFLKQLDEGRLDDVVEGYLRAGPTGRRLARRDQTHTAGLFDSLATRRGLLVMERRPPTVFMTEVRSVLSRCWRGVVERNPPSPSRLPNGLPGPDGGFASESTRRAS